MTQAASRNRTSKTTGVSPAPSRHNKGQSEHILKTIAGYESALTSSTIFAGVVGVWLVPALLYILNGVLGLAGGDDLIFRLAHTLVVGSAALGALSTIFLVYWYENVHANVPTLDAESSVIALRSIRFTAKVFVPAVALVAGANYVPGYSYLLAPALAIAFVALTSGIAHFVHQCARMLWRTSVSPAHPDAELPPTGTYAVFGWFAGLHLLWGVRITVGTTPWGAGHSLVMIGAGATMATVAILGAKYVSAVGIRQEARLFALGERVGDQSNVAPITSSQIKEAWSDSESLIGFDFD